MTPRAHVCHVDLAGPVPAVACRAGDVPVWMYFWRGDVPVGRRIFPAHELPVTDPDAVLAAAGAQAALPVAPAAGDPIDQRRVSVIVCTRDRPEPLAQCLAALVALDPPPGEIVVIDNAPATAATRAVVATFPAVRYVVEPRPGLDVARNTGLANARHDIVAFTDDDVVVTRQWADRLAACFADAAVVAATGLVIPAELATDAQLIFEAHVGGLDRGYEPRRYDAAYFSRHRHWGAPVWDIGAGANMAFRRTAVLAVGGFDERLDVGAAGCSGDSELWYRLLAAGGVCLYTPAAVVFHHHRATLPELRRQMHFYMRGHVTALLVQFEQHRHWGNLRRLLLGLPAYYARRVVVGMVRGFPLDNRILLGGAAGALAGLRYYAGARGIARSAKAATSAGRSV